MQSRMNFKDDPVQTQTPQLTNLGFSTINALDEKFSLSTPATIIRRPTDGSHWSAPDHVFGEATEVGTSAAKSDHDYNFKTEFQIWKVNKEFQRQKIPMSQPPLDLTPIGTNTTNAKYHIWTRLQLVKKRQTPSHYHDQRNRQNANKKRENSTNQRTRSQTHNCQTHHRENMICLMTEDTENIKSRENLICRKTANTENLK